jgi:hypothetical protein
MSDQKVNRPKTFISYSWSTVAHEQWVIDFAKRLVSDGVDVILDKWELREGQDKYAFMERMVTDITVSKVLAICDHTYTDKANSRKGGVGTESQIISKEIYDKIDQSKFIAIVREYDANGNAYVPAFFSTRIYIDMSTEEKVLENYDQLLRAVFNKPLHVKPSFGKPPSYLSEEGAVPSKTIYKLELLKKAIFDDKATVHGMLTDYLESYSSALEDYRIAAEITNTYDEHVLSSVEKFLPYRDEFIDFIKFVVLYRDDRTTYESIFEFFQGLLKYLHAPNNTVAAHDIAYDNYRFMLFELFLYHLTNLIKVQRFTEANLFLMESYFDTYETGRRAIVGYGIFDQYPDSIDRMRKNRLGLRNYYLSAEILKQRAYHSDLTFERLVQTDFVLFLRSAMNPELNYFENWTARTAGYAGYRVFELFARAASRRYFENVKILLNVADKQDFEMKYRAAFKDGLIGRREHMRNVDIETIINLERLDTI